MSLKHKLKKLVEQLTDTHIYRGGIPRGIDVFQDIADFLPNYHVDIVFDVGANAGSSTASYLTRFPSSHIISFEPASDTFLQLQGSVKGNKRVDCYQLALGSSKSEGKMVIKGNTDMSMSFLLGQSKKLPTNDDVRTESVDIVTLDEFCQTKRIDRINYLKIDTEGGDLEVLKGSENMLTEQRIDLVEVEAGMNPSNNWHMPFETLKKFLESHQYFLFGIYEQVDEWPTGEPHLRRTNPIFLSRRMIEVNKRSSETSA